MSECLICELIKQRKGVLFESEQVVALLAPEPGAKGQVIVAPKKHTPIIESVPDFVVAEMFQVANKVGIAVFEALGAQGTNVLVQNGPSAGQKYPHTVISMIPRFENDRLQIGWTPKSAVEEELEKLQNAISQETKNVGIFEKKKEKPIEVEGPKEVEKDDYRSKHLRRIP